MRGEEDEVDLDRVVVLDDERDQPQHDQDEPDHDRVQARLPVLYGPARSPEKPHETSVKTPEPDETGGSSSAPLGGVLGDPRNQAGLLRGRESASAGWAKGRAGGLGEGAQARLLEVAKLAACFILFAHCLVCSWDAYPAIER